MDHTQQRMWIMSVAALIVGLALGFWFGGSRGFDRGYEKAVAEAKDAEIAAGQQAAEEAAKAANPFQAVNPLEGVTANPFEKAKKVLNPFE